jgi:hypothetical protein
MRRSSHSVSILSQAKSRALVMSHDVMRCTTGSMVSSRARQCRVARLLGGHYRSGEDRGVRSRRPLE